MSTELERIQQNIKDAEQLIETAKERLAELEKKEATKPCPLEEGKEVMIDYVKVGKTNLGICRIRIDSAKTFCPKIIITSGWGTESIEKARAIVEEFGGSSD